MQVPNCDGAFVPPRKISEYLLSETHAIGKAKARFFRGLGFEHSNTALLEQGLVSIVQIEPVADVVRTPFGTKYVVDGPLKTPLGDTVSIRTVWIVEVEGERPSLVTTYPA